MIWVVLSFIMAMIEFTYGAQLDALSRRQTPNAGSRIEGYINQPVVAFSQASIINFGITGRADITQMSVILCQTTATDSFDFTNTNTYKLFDVFTDLCFSTRGSCVGRKNAFLLPADKAFKLTLETDGESVAPASVQNLFFCLSPANNGSFVCEVYSPLFSISLSSMQLSASSLGSNLQSNIPGPGAISKRAQSTLVLPTTVMTVGNLQTVLPFHIVPETVQNSATISTFTPSPTITGTSTMATTITASPTASSSSGGLLNPTSVPASKANGLSTGAKVGIALGSLVIFALLLLGLLFCLRRKHAKRSAHRGLSPHQPPEQVMLTRSMHTDSFGNASGAGGEHNGILAEKEDALASAAALNPTSTSSSPIHEPETRHSATTPYVPLPTSLPYSGTATTIPRRKPTSATLASTVSRNISSASALSSGPVSPRSQTTPRSDDFTPYHDVPIYGDARHSPQVFQGGISGGEGAGGDRPAGSTSPFVTEEMSAEEVARLEEEERRIDAAIAESERR